MNSENEPLPVNDMQNPPDSLWGPQRHKYIAMQADKRLTNKAKLTVDAILKPLNQSQLGEIATWADEIKGGGPNDPETKKSLADFPDMQHKSWHFVNLPLGVRGYDREMYSSFTNDTDVVQMIVKSVRVLMGDLEIMSKINALRWLTHIVGDLHQPLHVACTYLDFDSEIPDFIIDPKVIEENGLTKNSDQGGNLFLLPVGDNVTLHSYWDSKIPSHAPTAEIIEQIPNDIIEQPITMWPALWAYDSVKKSRIAYEPLKIQKRDGKKYQLAWEGKDSYDQKCGPIVTEQLALGSVRLAALVNELFS